MLREALGVLSLALAVFAALPGSRQTVLVGASLLVWFVALLYACIASQECLWKFKVFQTLVFASCAVTSAACTSGPLAAGGTLLLGLICQPRSKNYRHGPHRFTRVVFVVIVGAIAAVTLLASVSSDGQLFRKVPGGETCNGQPGCQDFVFPPRGLADGRPGRRYGFCGMAWPMGGEGDTVSDRCADRALGVADFGQMATLAKYIPNASMIDLLVQKSFPGWQRVGMQAYSPFQGRRNSFVHVTRGATSVIAVRGTSTLAEVVLDLSLWLPVAFLQLMQRLGPSLYSIRSLLERMLSWGVGSDKGVTAFRDLLEYVQSVQAADSPFANHTLYLTGHSLGGGLAAIVGAIRQVQAVTFSAPGLQATSAIVRPSPSLEDLQRYTVNVMPSSDVFPMLDEQAGMVLNIHCPLASLQCHLQWVTMCELLAACGDGGRNYTRSCDVCREAGQVLPRDLCH